MSSSMEFSAAEGSQHYPCVGINKTQKGKRATGVLGQIPKPYRLSCWDCLTSQLVGLVTFEGNNSARQLSLGNQDPLILTLIGSSSSVGEIRWDFSHTLPSTLKSNTQPFTYYVVAP